MRPRVEVVAYTKFIGDPAGKTPMGELIQEKEQDRGSDLARLIEYAARECYDSYGKGRSSEEFHQHILEVQHGSVLEHAALSFRISGISRGCSHELVRHRAGCAISQRSTRYVDESESEWAWHPLLERVENLDRLEDISDYVGDFYLKFVEDVEKALRANGADNQTARKQARGAARGVLGNALSTSMIWTANVRALRNVLEQRASQFADAEIRLLANRLYEAALPYIPEYLADYEKGVCPDGIGYSLTTSHRKV